MIYEVFAMYPEGAYKVAEGTDRDHCADFAERSCKAIGQWPYAFLTLIRGKNEINAKIFSFEDLKNRKN